MDQSLLNNTGVTPEDGIVREVTTGYRARKLQKSLHAIVTRFNVLVCHRRFGKTVWAVNELIHKALNNPLRNPQYAYVAPTYKQVKKIAWNYFVDYTRFLPGATPNKSELCIYIERPHRLDPVTGKSDPDVITLYLIGADDPDALRGMYLDGAVIDEFAQCDPIVWGQILRPSLADRKKIAWDLGIKEDMEGIKMEPWAIFIGTPKGQNHFYLRYKKAQECEAFCHLFESTHNLNDERAEWEEIERFYNIFDAGDLESLSEKDATVVIGKWPADTQRRYKEWRKYKACKSWFTVLYKASETGVLDRDELDEMRQDLSPEEIEQELECSFTAAILGSYWGHLVNSARLEGRICILAYNPKFPVDTHWDIGIGDKTAIWFRQQTPEGFKYLHYYEQNGKGIDHYAAVIEALAKPPGTRTEVDPGEFIEGRGFQYGRHVWPHDGAAQEFGTGQTRQETAREKGIIVQIQERQAVDDGINAGRKRLRVSFFDEKYCEKGIDCLYNYQKEYDQKARMFKNKPLHDWSSHGASAFRYSSLDDRPSYFPHDQRRGKMGKSAKAKTNYDEFAA